MNLEAICSLAIMAAMMGGVMIRSRPAVHVPVMWTVIVADVALLLWVELQAHAIERVAGTPIPWWLWVHVAIATLLIVGYVVAIVFGLKLKRDPGNGRARAIHKRNGWLVVALRFGLLATTPGLLFPPLGGGAG
jgi:FtsH-binding integral membrane protein